MQKDRTSAICTCVEGDYHYGLAALVNALVVHGFQGDIRVLYRPPLPPWVGSSSGIFEVPPVTLHFDIAESPAFLASQKADYMLSLLDKYEHLTSISYFDPDIVPGAPWSFFESWMRDGVALCEDNCFGLMGSNHFIRKEWAKFAAQQLGREVTHELSRSFNSGFVGVRREHRSLLEDWKNATQHLPNIGIGISAFKPGTRRDPFFGTDQDTLNVACMINPSPLSTLGMEGMGFTPGMDVMWHAVDNPKPWRRRYLGSLLRHGTRVPAAHREFWRHANGVIRPWTAGQVLLRQLDLKLAAAVSRFYHSA
ncbi:hypothetical protein [Verrucomicrobium sp. BvORR106]|uniref:hypothetical protein n=1 Tax=Verrucomicrobium sp. BvORR106 TaxID=1403819 RepID=UPI00057091B9|nr:hypothetical protein [Verrucomicrobium sp. BvORR106]